MDPSSIDAFSAYMSNNMNSANGRLSGIRMVYIAYNIWHVRNSYIFKNVASSPRFVIEKALMQATKITYFLIMGDSLMVRDK